MIYYEAPTPYIRLPSLFLAGGITGCPDWQTDVVNRLRDSELIVFNPRRREFPINDPSAAPEQIKWEKRHLDMADAIMFWFPCETLCPTTLFELGSKLRTPQTLFVGTHPDYARRVDISVQMQLARPAETLFYNINDMLFEIGRWVTWQLAVPRL